MGQVQLKGEIPDSCQDRKFYLHIYIFFFSVCLNNLHIHSFAEGFKGNMETVDFEIVLVDFGFTES